ncbi:hypothetical protein [Polyangium aurulentum]|uniref:hypothetical protein n=1 Tax=Polyangium aurulentum TaxID=2567896 RepID=UPI0010AEC42B|nr:hypothetical protein [Polyangium aurulentum]UQA59108.1 hypothetical protein E8A73_000905 [Polyangium aurulentum]
MPTETPTHEDTRPGRDLGPIAWGFKLFAISFLVLELLYVVVGNLFLNLGGLKRVASHNPDGFTLDYASVWTFWPGHAEARGLVLTGQAEKLQWMLRLDRATVDVAMGDLLERRFHATRVRGDGAIFRLRMRLEPEEVPEPQTRTLPPIKGFADPPLVAFGPPEADPTDEEYKLWSVELNDILVDMREIWIESYRYTGDVGIKGDFSLKPLRSLRVLPSTFAFRSGDLHLGEHQALSGIEGTLEAQLDTFDPKGISWLGVLRAFTARANFRSDVPSMSFAHHYLDKQPAIRKGRGVLDVHLGVDRGVFIPGSEARVMTDHVEVSAKDFEVALGVEASFRVDDHARGEFAALVEHGTLQFHGADAPAAEVQGARLALEAPADFIGPWKPQVYSLDLPSLRVSDMRRLQPVAPSGMKFQGGSALIQGKVARIAGGLGQGAVHADMWNASARWKDVAMTGSFGADLQVQAVDVAKRTARMRGEVGAGEVSIEGGGAAWSGWWARMLLDEFELRAEKGLDLLADARFKLRDVRPIVGVMAALDAVPPWTKEIMTMEGATIDVDLRKQGPGLAFGVEALAGEQRVAGRLVKREEEKSGAFLVRSGILSAGIRLGKSDAEITPAAGDDWLKEQLAALRGK